MTSSAHIITPDAVDIDLFVEHHPEFDRVIRMPRGAPTRWVVEAFLLSIGVPPDRAEGDEQAYDDYVVDAPGDWHRDMWGWSTWGEEVRNLPIRDFPHRVNFTFRSAPEPLIGDPQVSVIADAPRRRPVGPWQDGEPVAASDDVNHELLHRFSVVLPHAASVAVVNPSRGVPAGSRIAALLASLTPVRRLALLIHLDDSELLGDRTRDLAVVEAAILPMRTLIERIPTDGVPQDSETGWLAESVGQHIADSLAWRESDAVVHPAEALISLARRARLIRRFKGRVVATNAGRSIVEVGSRSLSRFAEAVTAELTKYRSWYRAGRHHELDVALVLLAIADGTMACFADVPEILKVGRSTIAAPQVDEYDGWSPAPVWDEPDAEPGVSEQMQALIDGLATLSTPGEYGSISLAMRAVAREALLAERWRW